MGISERFVSFLRRAAVNIIFSPETRANVIRVLNEKVDIPVLSEEQERELFELVYDTLEDAFRSEQA